MHVMPDASLPWLSLVALGALHGINPAMGWLFAVGRGLQERDRSALWRAFAPLALGHAAAIALALLLAVALDAAVPTGWLRWIVAASLFAVGADGLLRHRHVRLAGMRARPHELAAWSFLMASAHGAGLMVLPFVLGTDASASLGSAARHGVPASALGTHALGVAAPLLHTLGYVVATVLLAVVVYEKVGLRILRRAWINVNILWAAALVTAGVAALRSS